VSHSPTAHYRIVDQEHDDRTHDCNDHAPNIQPSDARGAKGREQEAAYERADDSERNIEPKTLTLPVDDLASDEPGYQAKDDPANDAHARASLCAKLFINSSRLPKLDLILSMILPLILCPADRRDLPAAMMARDIIVQRLVRSQAHIGGQSNIINPSYSYCDFTAKRQRMAPCAGA
jgi:hypothetical protein